MFRLKSVFLLVLSLTLSACADSAKQSESEDKMDKKEEKTLTDGKSPASPTVTTSESATSKPLSESEGSAEGKKKDELYIVPNRFPEQRIIKDKEQDKDKKDENALKKDNKKDDEKSKDQDPPA